LFFADEYDKIYIAVTADMGGQSGRMGDQPRQVHTAESFCWRSTGVLLRFA